MHSKGPQMLNKMIKKREKLLNSKKKRADEQKSSVSLKFTDSDRMKSFNQVVKENLGWVLIGHKYQGEVLGKGHQRDCGRTESQLTQSRRRWRRG